MDRPVPVPRKRPSKAPNDHVDSGDGVTCYENVDLIKPKAETYENVQLTLDDGKFMPKPAPRRKISAPISTVEVVAATEISNVETEVRHDNLLPKSTGAIRKAPQIPKFHDKEEKIKVDEVDKRERRNSSNSTNSGCSESSSYKTASPK